MKDETSYESFQAEISKYPKCGRLFISHRKDQKYCSSTCRSGLEGSSLILTARTSTCRVGINVYCVDVCGRGLSRMRISRRWLMLPSYEDMLRLTVH